MTGFGRSTNKNGSGQLSITIRAVNSRYFDLKIRGVDLDPELDLEIRTRARKILKRGNIQIVMEVDLRDKSEGLLKLNKSRYEDIESLLQSIQMEYGRHIELSNIVTLKDLFLENDQSNLQQKQVISCLNEALKQVDGMRVSEGTKIRETMEEQVCSFHKKIDKLESFEKAALMDQKAKYKKKINELLGTVLVDEYRLAQEIAVLAEKADITEEIVRCRSHLDQYLAFLHEKEPVGKRLTFLLQETNREINTIGAKTDIIKISHLVVDLKDELEKIREQVQNIV